MRVQNVIFAAEKLHVRYAVRAREGVVIGTGEQHGRALCTETAQRFTLCQQRTIAAEAVFAAEIRVEQASVVGQRDAVCRPALRGFGERADRAVGDRLLEQIDRVCVCQRALDVLREYMLLDDLVDRVADGVGIFGKAVEGRFTEHLLGVAAEVETGVFLRKGIQKRLLLRHAAEHALGFGIEQRGLLQTAVENAAVPHAKIHVLRQKLHGLRHLGIVRTCDRVLRRDAEARTRQIDRADEVQHQRQRTFRDGRQLRRVL